ncbi:hypothetical protein SAMN06296056_1011112 [Priestia filamentosa]|jgi:hypothetical protein|nr:hypothetical protein FH5_00489 [Priestia endophytica]SMF13545.1 hypothetical protein SAMN06296056_1011112 [Priestia filamentosa]
MKERCNVCKLEKKPHKQTKENRYCEDCWDIINKKYAVES